MELDTKPISFIASSVIGGLIGYLSGPGIVLVPWATVGIIIGTFCTSRKAAILNGSVYGFMLAYVFMLASYDGTEQVRSKLLPFLAFGIVGALCGCLLSVFGSMLKKRIVKNK